MRNTLLATALLTSILTMTACSQSQLGHGQVEGETTFSDGIIGGSAVSTQEDIAKTTVQIYSFQAFKDPKTGKTGIQSQACTGTLLAEDIVLTAAHCTITNPRQMMLYFSTQIPKNMFAFVNAEIRDPNVRLVVGGKTGTAWPKLRGDQTSNWGDIALLKFEGGIPQGYQVANLLPTTEVLSENQVTTLAGFGYIDGVKKISSTELLKVDVSIKNPKFSNTEMMINSGKKGPCHGDSGGPAYVTGSDGKQYVAGVTSHADFETDPEGLCIADTVYTKTQPYTAWIKRTIKALQAPTFQTTPIPQPQDDGDSQAPPASKDPKSGNLSPAA